MFNATKDRIRHFARDERGTMLVEFVIVAPLLFWVIVSMFSYWDVYRSMNTLQKAAYTVSDIVSRTNEDVGLDANDFAGYKSLLNYLIQQPQQARIRITNIQWDATNNEYVSVWSCSPDGDLAAYATDDLNNSDVKDYLPVMPDDDTVILVETLLDYDPIFYIRVPFYGDPTLDEMGNLVMKQFVVTRPRLAPSIIMDSCSAAPV